MWLRISFCAVTGLLCAVLCIGCKIPSIFAGSAISESVQGIDQGGVGWRLHAAAGQSFELHQDVDRARSVREFMVWPRSLPSEWWQMWVGVFHEVDGLYRVSFHARALSSDEVSRFYFRVGDNSPPWQTILHREFEVDSQGVLVDIVFNFSGEAVFQFSPSSLEPFIVRGFSIAKVVSADF